MTRKSFEVELPMEGHDSTETAMELLDALESAVYDEVGQPRPGGGRIVRTGDPRLAALERFRNTVRSAASDHRITVSAHLEPEPRGSGVGPDAE